MNMDGGDVGSSSTAGGKRRSKSRRGEAEMTRPCSECGKSFWSWKALFGHMRCHPERQWRGINPPPNPHQYLDLEVAESLLLLANGVQELEGSGGGRFECSSCKKVFGSHQALGGHRASHKNVKGCFAITRSTESEIDDQQGLRSSTITTHHHDTHMCTICLRVFSSGQALGGHKRCHWEEPSVNHGYAFDLNLPPPPEPEPEDNNDHTTVTSSGSYSSPLTLDLRLGL